MILSNPLLLLLSRLSIRFRISLSVTSYRNILFSFKIIFSINFLLGFVGVGIFTPQTFYPQQKNVYQIH